MTPDEVRFALFRLRLMVGSMIVSLVGFSLVASFLLERSGPEASQAGQPLFGVLGVLIFAETSAWVVLRRSFVERHRRLLRAQPELSPEAPALLGVVVYLMTGKAALLAVPAVAVFVLLRLQADENDYRQFVREVTG